MKSEKWKMKNGKKNSRKARRGNTETAKKFLIINLHFYIFFSAFLAFFYLCVLCVKQVGIL